jgi:hypothetical protein
MVEENVQADALFMCPLILAFSGRSPFGGGISCHRDYQMSREV